MKIVTKKKTSLSLRCIFLKICNYMLEIKFNNSSKSFRIFLLSSVESIYFKILKFILLISDSRNLIYIISGKEKNSNEEITALFISSPASVKYLSSLVFSEVSCEIRKEKISIFKIKKIIKNYSQKVDIIFIKSDSFYANYLQKKGFTSIPQFVGMKLDISKPLDEIYNNFNKSIRYNIRKAQKNGLSYEITDNIDKLKFFYDKMYLPYANLRYVDTAIISGYENIKYIFNRGCLMFVKDENSYILGNLIMKNKKSCLMAFVGIHEGKEDYLDKGASIASIYYTILWAKEQGYSNIEFGYVRSFLKNGVLQHNKQWGAELYKTNFPMIGDESVGIYSFKVTKWNTATRSFLKNNPFICVENNILKANIFIDEKFNENDMNHLKKKYFLRGLKKLTVSKSKKFYNIT